MVYSHPVEAHKLVVEKLQEIANRQKPRDFEVDHIEADQLLLQYINSDEVTVAYLNAIEEW